MKIYLLGIAKEYGFNIQEYTYNTLKKTKKNFER